MPLRASAPAPPLVMRRLGVGGLDPIHLQRFHRRRLPLHLLLQPVQFLPLSDDHLVQLLHLMFQVGEAGFDAFQPLGSFVFQGNKIVFF